MLSVLYRTFYFLGSWTVGSLPDVRNTSHATYIFYPATHRTTAALETETQHTEAPGQIPDSLQYQEYQLRPNEDV